MHPVTLNVDYPGGGRNRLTALFRPALAIPIIIVVTALVTALQLVVAPTLLMVLFRGKYPALVVRLQRRVAPVRRPGQRLLAALARRVPVDGRGAGRSSQRGVSRTAQQFHAADQVAAGAPSLRCACGSGNRWGRGHRRRVAGHTLHREVPAGDVRLRRGRGALVAPRAGVYAHPRDGRVSAVPSRRVAAGFSCTR